MIVVYSIYKILGTVGESCFLCPAGIPTATVLTVWYIRLIKKD